MRSIQTAIGAGLCVLVLSVAQGPFRLAAQEAPDRIYMEDLTVSPGALGFGVPVLVDTSQARQGFTIAVKYDPAVLRLVTVEGPGGRRPSVDLTGTACEAAEWADGRCLPDEGRFYWSVLTDLTSPAQAVIPAGKGQILVKLYFDAVAAEPTSTSIALESGLGSIPGRWTTILATKGMAPTHPELVAGTVSVAGPIENRRFLRGNCNGDGTLDIADAVSVLGYLFLGDAAPSCREACNTNSDAGIDLSDAVYLLLHLFTGGGPMAPPFPGCDEAPPSRCAVTTCTF
jgi:hypothetical protein